MEPKVVAVLLALVIRALPHEAEQAARDVVACLYDQLDLA